MDRYNKLRDTAAAASLLNSLEFWGGAGSIDDLILFV
jgi:hypothetical protein